MKKSIFTILSCALLAAPAMMAEEAVEIAGIRDTQA